MVSLRSVRDALRKHWFVPGTLAVIGTAFSGVALQQSLAYDLSTPALVRRYFRLDHYGGDLDIQVAALNAKDLAGLEWRTNRMNPGGLVYTDGNTLTFYRINPQAAGPAQSGSFNLATFQSLFSALSRTATEEFLGVTERPEVEQRLKRRQLTDLLDTVEERGLEDPKGRSAARVVMDEFVPYTGESYDLERIDELRFYKGTNPAGEYVGAWEFLGFGESLSTQEGIERAGSAWLGFAKGRYVAIERQPSRFVIRDFYDGKECRYSIPLE